MSKYRLTTRGKVVLTLVILIILVLIVQGFQLIKSNLDGTNSNEINIDIGNDDDKNTKVSTTTSTSSIESSSVLETKTIDSIEATSTSDNTVDLTSSNGDSSLIIETEDERNLLNASTTIYFSSDKATLSDGMKASIDAFCLTAKAYPAIRISVEGIALRLLDYKKSEAIAYARGQVVVDYMIRSGISIDRIDMTTRIVDRINFSKDELQKAIVAELFFEGYQRSGK